VIHWSKRCRFTGSLALVTNHFEIGDSNVASLGCLLLLVLFGFTFSFSADSAPSVPVIVTL